MKAIPVTAIADIGKSNKKILLFDEQYQLVFEHVVQLSEIIDEEGFPCEDLVALKQFIIEGLASVVTDRRFQVNAINFSAYGASFVHLDAEGIPLSPLYNYLKPFPEQLQDEFYYTYGGREELSRVTASPVLGSLNSGLQLYRIKKEMPDLFSTIRCSLHLPQYIAFLISGLQQTEITSVGCHTHLWDYDHRCYHPWVEQEKLIDLFPPLVKAQQTASIDFCGKSLRCGTGLHDSSAALIPHLLQEEDPFLLLSTGTWCIALNPFNHAPLTQDQLQNDCLCYLQYTGEPVKASRFFGGHIHEQGVAALADRHSLSRNEVYQHEEYRQLMQQLVDEQAKCITRVEGESPLNTIIVDGGFSTNTLFMKLLSEAFPKKKIKASTMHQGSALGAAMVLG